MARESVVYGLSILMVAAGLVVMVYGEYVGMRSILPFGGVMALLGVGILTGSVFRL